MKVPDLKPEPDQWKISPQDTHPQLAAGIPMAFQFAITASGTMIMQSAINLFGSEAVAAYTAAGKLQNILTQGMGWPWDRPWQLMEVRIMDVEI